MRWLALLATLLLSATPAEAQPLPRGFIIGSGGEKCWYRQTVEDTARHFHDRLTAVTGTMVFDDPNCLPNDEVSQMMINNVVTRWYGQPDAMWRTRRSEMFTGSRFQVRGLCIQSGRYPTMSIAIEYIGSARFIRRVMHSQALQACTGSPIGSDG